MVMWMSRVERKRTERKSKRCFRICIFVQIVLLVCGLLIVDSQIRVTLGTDETCLVSYKKTEDDRYIIHIMGDSHLIDVPAIKSQTYNKFAQLREMTYSIIERIEQRFKNTSY